MSAPRDVHEHRRVARELLALDAVGVLSPTDDTGEGWVREHLESGCAVCAQASADVERLYEDLLLAAPPIEPPHGLRRRVLEAVRAAPVHGDATGASEASDATTASENTGASSAAPDVQVWNRWLASGAPKFYTLAASDTGWEKTPIEGIQVRSLHVDEEHGTVTMLVRMAPGTAYPRHRHADDEQCYVLEGDLRVEDQVLRAGDYQFAPTGSIHGVQSTGGGCTLLVVSSQRDEILSG